MILDKYQKDDKKEDYVFPLSAALYREWKQNCIDNYERNPRCEFQLFKFKFNNEEKSILYTSKYFDNERSIADHIESRKNNIYYYHY